MAANYTIKIPATIWAQIYLDENRQSAHNDYQTVDDAAVEFTLDNAIVTILDPGPHGAAPYGERLVTGDERRRVLEAANIASWPVAEWLGDLTGTNYTTEDKDN